MFGLFLLSLSPPSKLSHINFSIFNNYQPIIMLVCLAVWGFEFRPSVLWGRNSVTWAMPPALFTLVILEIRSHFFFFAQVALDLNLPILGFLPSLGWQAHTTLSSYWVICPGWPGMTILPISASQVARVTGLSHQHLVWLIKKKKFLLYVQFH
jgi:hypothetical protein